MHEPVGHELQTTDETRGTTTGVERRDTDDAEYPLTVRQAARFLGVSAQTVYLWVERKQISHLRVMAETSGF
ncbi:MAG: helix-turn-helix domain-containing protein [Vicinamibacterales bacterium]